MARLGGGVEWWRGAKLCSYKRATAVICCVNLVAAVYVLRSLYAYSSPSSGSRSPFQEFKYTGAQIKQMEESIRVRKELLPVELVRRAKELRKELPSESSQWEMPRYMRKMVTDEILQALRGVKNATNVTEQRDSNGYRRSSLLLALVHTHLHGPAESSIYKERCGAWEKMAWSTSPFSQIENEAPKLRQRAKRHKLLPKPEAVELWRIEKLKAVKMLTQPNSTSNSRFSVDEAKILEAALEFNWHTLSEGIGLWMPADVINNEINDKPENAQEDEEEDIIPGRPLPPECNAELHTDYGGAAVRWGLTHHKDSAADCCQACLDQAKDAKPEEMKCNIWVYCPSESGCFSPDIYEHHQQECWLKQASEPQLNFKSKYSESYRSSHPNAPVYVPWISGVVST